MARIFHLVTLLLLLFSGLLFKLGIFYWLGMLIVAGMFIYEHSLVREDDLEQTRYSIFQYEWIYKHHRLSVTFLDYILSMELDIIIHAA